MIKETREILKRLGAGRLLRGVEFCVLNFLAVFVFFGCLLLKKITGRRLVFTEIRGNRIGHLAANTELFLRRLRSGRYFDRSNIYVGFVRYFPVSNRQLLTMYKRQFFILESGWLEKLLTTWFKRTEFYYIPSFHSNEYFEFNNFEPILTFTAEEEARGKQLLANMGIGAGDWFVCFHSRDGKYLGAGSDYHDYRDSDINNYLKAAELIAERGGYALRMGEVVDGPLPPERHPRIIDYAVEHRSDFMDIYLSARCKFFLGNTAGLFIVPMVFSIPVACANFMPLELTTLRAADLFIPKKLWLENEKRYLKFREALELGASRYFQSEQYKKAGLTVVENSAEEISALAAEMNSRLNGAGADTAGDELQAKYRGLFGPGHLCHDFTTRVGRDFLAANSGLL
jgi:putative glycosyltransferase (TIGR04372 family)